MANSTAKFWDGWFLGLPHDIAMDVSEDRGLPRPPSARRAMLPGGGSVNANVSPGVIKHPGNPWAHWASRITYLYIYIYK